MNEKYLLRCLVHIVGRTAIPAKVVRAAVGTGKNRVKAFNLFDGSHTMQEWLERHILIKGISAVQR